MQVNIKMCDFGGSSVKPMTLFSNAPFIDQIQGYAEPPARDSLNRLAVLHEDNDGRHRPREGAALKASQAYTPQFGAAIAGVFAANRKAWRASVLASNRSALRVGVRASGRACGCTGDCPDAHAILTSPPAALQDAWADARLMLLLSSIRAQAVMRVPDALVDQVIDLDP